MKKTGNLMPIQQPDSEWRLQLHNVLRDKNSDNGEEIASEFSLFFEIHCFKKFAHLRPLKET